jgi:hypothetical protein
MAGEDGPLGMPLAADRLIFDAGVAGTRRDTKNATTLMEAPDDAEPGQGRQ